MADLGSSIFNKKATEKLRSPEDLDKYVKVTTPSVWIVLAASLVLLAGLMAWGFFGSVTTNLSAKGILLDAEGGNVMCFIPISVEGKVSEGNSAIIEGHAFTVSHVSEMPLSRSEAQEMLGSDYLTNQLVHDEWVFRVDFDGPADQLWEGVPLDVSIEVDSVSPISLIIK